MKRLFDISFSFLGLILLSPLLFIISLSIVFDSRGGVLFRQTRVGRYGKDFKILKFRTMYPDAEKRGQITIGKRDPRVTPVGHFLRSYKLDELPQLINILIGDMSFVGPRPEVPKYVAMYSEDQKRVLDVRPGLTDFASLEYFNEGELLGASDDPERTYIDEIMPAKLELNMKYLERPQLTTDIKLIVRTIAKIVGS